MGLYGVWKYRCPYLHTYCMYVYLSVYPFSRNFKQEAVLCQASSSPLDEENEVFFERCIDKVMYEPVCLCLISSTPMFDVLQVRALFNNLLGINHTYVRSIVFCVKLIPIEIPPTSTVTFCTFGCY